MEATAPQRSAGTNPIHPPSSMTELGFAVPWMQGAKKERI
jgi:hypothetical protein